MPAQLIVEDHGSCGPKQLEGTWLGKIPLRIVWAGFASSAMLRPKCFPFSSWEWTIAFLLHGGMRSRVVESNNKGYLRHESDYVQSVFPTRSDFSPFFFALYSSLRDTENYLHSSGLCSASWLSLLFFWAMGSGDRTQGSFIMHREIF